MKKIFEMPIVCQMALFCYDIRLLEFIEAFLY